MAGNTKGMSPAELSTFCGQVALILEAGLPLYDGMETLAGADSASANAVYAVVGDLGGAQVNYPEGEGVVIKYDDLTEGEKDMVKVIGRQYAAHAVTAPGRFCNIAKPAGT